MIIFLCLSTLVLHPPPSKHNHRLAQALRPYFDAALLITPHIVALTSSATRPTRCAPVPRFAAFMTPRSKTEQTLNPPETLNPSEEEPQWTHGTMVYIPDCFGNSEYTIPMPSAAEAGDMPWEDENKRSTAQRCSLLLKRTISEREEMSTELFNPAGSIYLDLGFGGQYLALQSPPCAQSLMTEPGDQALTTLERHSLTSALVSLRNAQGHLNHFEPSRILVGGTTSDTAKYHRGAEIVTAMTSEAARSTSNRCKELLNVLTTKRDQWIQELKKLSCTSDTIEVYPQELKSLGTQIAMWGIDDLTRNDRMCLRDALTAIKDAQVYLSFLEPGQELDGKWDEAYEILSE